MDAAPSLHFISNNYTFILTAQPTTSPYPRNHVTLPTEMRRYNLRIVALIHLVLSIVDFTFAGLAQSRAMYKSRADRVGLAEDMTKVSEKRYEPLGKLLEESRKRSTAGHAHSREDPVTEVEDTVSNPDDEKFFSDELKEALRETYYYVAVNTAVTTFASPSTFLSGLAPLHHGAYVLPLFSLCQHSNSLGHKIF